MSKARISRPEQPGFHIRRADWERDGERLRLIRRQVFVREQQVPEALEWDGLDTEAVHLIAEDASGEAIGTARLLPSGQIGRMAVASEHRRRGVGRALLLRLLRIVEQDDFPQPFLHAQVSALPFYKALGFRADGDVFVEAGIDHQHMLFSDPSQALQADLQSRQLGQGAEPLRLATLDAQRLAVAQFCTQARTQLLILSPDLEPGLYDRAPVIDALLQLAVQRAGREPVRVLVEDAETPLKRGHRIIELSRRFSSSIQIRCVAEEFLGSEAPCLLADGLGYARRRAGSRDELLLDFHDPAGTRQLRRSFQRIWERSTEHPGLRRLYI